MRDRSELGWELTMQKEKCPFYLLMPLVCCVFGLSATRADDVSISEIVAANVSTLADEDGDYPDWVEIYNGGTSAANLDGWFLTDSEDKLQKWQFPAVELAPEGFLIVFASGKDRFDPSSPLHTSFKLRAGGEFLALVDPDGQTIASQFAPEFPPLQDDMSYGFSQEVAESSVVPSGAEGRVFVPTDGSLGTDWVDPGFDDSDWIAGTTAFGFDLRTNNFFAEPIQADLGDLMFEKNATAYIRIPFEVDPATFDLLHLYMKYEDGFIAYLNGIEVARDNAPEAPAWNSPSDGSRASSAADEFQRFDITPSKSLLSAGSNLLAIHAMNNRDSSKDFLILPELKGVSLGRLQTDRGRFFGVATPLEPNGPGFDGIAATPTASAPDGVYSETILVELSSAAGDIRFTVDGTEPTADSELYIEPILLERAAQLKAKSFQEGFLASATLTRHYLLLDPDVADFDSNLPLVVVHTFGDVISATSLAPSYLHVVDRGADGRASITGPADFSGPAGFRVRGKSTAGRVKASYAVETWDEERNDKDVSIFGFPEESDWVLYGPYNFDRAMIRNALMYELSNQVGRYAVRTRFVEVFRTIERRNIRASDYFGVYVFMEKIKRGENRVDVEALLPEHKSEPEITGGYIFKIDQPDPGDAGFTTSRGTPRGDGKFAWVYPKEDEVTNEQSSWFRNHLNELEDALYGPNFQSPDFGYAKYLDVLSFIDHHILNEITKNPDGLRLSAYMFKPRGEKIQAGPIWDFDRTMGSDDDLRSASPEGWYSLTNYEWWGQLAEDPAYERSYQLRWQELRDGPLSTQNILSLVDSMAEEIAEAQVRNYERWTGLISGDGWQERIDALKEWLALRMTWIDTQMIAPPELSPEGGRVTLPLEVTMTHANPQGDIVYTTDGTDPKLENGETNPTAVVYDGEPVTITQNTFIRARTRVRSGSWSELSEAGFFGDVPTLALTELMYDPLEGGAFEFIELFNYGEKPVNLLGVSFSRGVDFVFTDPTFETLNPGDYIVVVRDIEAFESRYAPSENGIKVAGQYDGVLRDSAEVVQLVGPAQELIVEFVYSSEWHPSTAGAGHSLVLVRNRYASRGSRRSGELAAER